MIVMTLVNVLFTAHSHFEEIGFFKNKPMESSLEYFSMLLLATTNITIYSLPFTKWEILFYAMR